MDQTERSNSGRLLVAIDVAKRVHELLVRWPHGKSKAFRAAGNYEEFSRMTAFLQQQGLAVRAALEPTAYYHCTIAHWLQRHGAG